MIRWERMPHAPSHHRPAKVAMLKIEGTDKGAFLDAAIKRYGPKDGFVHDLRDMMQDGNIVLWMDAEDADACGELLKEMGHTKMGGELCWFLADEKALVLEDEASQLHAKAARIREEAFA